MKVLVSIYRPNGYDPSTEDAAMAAAIDAVNQEMIDAGVRHFVGGLQSPERAVSLCLDAVGEVTVSDGTYGASGSFVGGLWVLEVQTLEEAIAWGEKAARACRADVEVRPFH